MGYVQSVCMYQFLYHNMKCKAVQSASDEMYIENQEPKYISGVQFDGLKYLDSLDGVVL